MGGSRGGGNDENPPRAWRHLWAAARPDAADHPVDLPTLGEYAALLELDGREAADEAFPAVAQHLSVGCHACSADVLEMVKVLAAERLRPDDPAVR